MDLPMIARVLWVRRRLRRHERWRRHELKRHQAADLELLRRFAMAESRSTEPSTKDWNEPR